MDAKTRPCRSKKGAVKRGLENGGLVFLSTARSIRIRIRMRILSVNGVSPCAGAMRVEWKEGNTSDPQSGDAPICRNLVHGPRLFDVKLLALIPQICVKNTPISTVFRL
jgi:hypothetical protein